MIFFFQVAVNALKNFQEHHLVINLISQALTEKAGNQGLMRATGQLQIKYVKLKHQLMPRNLPLQVEHVTLFCFSFHIMMPSDLHLLILCITCFLELPNMFLKLGLTWAF